MPMQKKYPFMLAIDVILKVIWYVQWIFIFALLVISLVILIDPTWINVGKISGFSVEFSRIYLGDINLNDGIKHTAFLSNGIGRLHISDFKQNIIFFRILSVAIDTFIYIYIIYLLRKIFSSLKTGVFFNRSNGEYIKKIAYTILVLALLPELVSYLIESHVTNNIELANVVIRAKFNLDFRTIFLGLLIFAMAKAFIRGAEIKEEHELTV
ncbi:MAG: DUF2975 domain-containing protein [Bacteroidales bacterium]|nr:DUF2975 domain-containing protein [Bacteroidales bacterium]